MRRVVAAVRLAVMMMSMLAGCGDADEQTGPSNLPADRAEPEASDSSSNTMDLRTGSASLSGRIVVTGAIPELDPLVRQGSRTVKDAAVCGETGVPDESLQVGPQNGLANAFVYLKALPEGWSPGPAPESEVILDQKACRFLPHVSIVRTGQPVRLLNDDPIEHNTHTLALANPSFNQINQRNDRDGMVLTYEEAERQPVQISCDLHPWMRAYQLVLNHNFAALTSGSGEFRIEMLPHGELDFRVWHERSGFLERSLTVSLEEDQETEITLEYGIEQFATQ